MRGVVLVLLVVSLGAMGPLVARAAAPVDDDEVRDALGRVYSDGRYQRARPDGRDPGPSTTTAPEPDFEWPRFDKREVAPSSASGVSEALLWVLGIGLGLALVAVVAREGVHFAKRRRRKRAALAVVQPDALGLADLALERLPADLQRARALAAEGRYDEAVHVLLHGALRYLHALASFSLEPSFTSREVLARAPLATELRPAFGDLVSTVEVSLFGGMAVDADDFGRCESSFVTLHRRLGGAALG